MRFFILLGNIFILLFFVSCSKSKKEESRRFFLNKNIEFKLSNNELNNSVKIIKPEYDFAEQKDIIKYKVKSLQLFTSVNNQVLLEVNFIINFKKTKETKEGFKYKIYMSDFKIKDKVYYGYFNLKSISKKYNLIMNALYFNILIDKYGKKSFEIENKIGLNSNLKSMGGLIFNIINYIFLEFPEGKIENNHFKFQDKKYELTSSYNDDGSVYLKYNTSVKRDFTIEKGSSFIILKSDDDKSKIRILFSLKEKMPWKINLLFEDGDKLKFEEKEYIYFLKNYYFIERL